MTRVAIFTDNDFDKVNGVTTTLKAVLRFAPPSTARIYTAAELGVDTPSYFATRSIGLGLPFYREMRVYWPRVRAFARELRRSRTDVIHVTTPGPVGLAGRWLASHLGLPLVGSYHTEFGRYTTLLSGSRRLGGALERYVRGFYASCDPLLVPSEATRSLLTSRGYRSDRMTIWSRGVDVDQFSPARASLTMRNDWHVDHRRPAILYAGRLSHEKGLAIVEPVRRALLRHGLEHRFVFVGNGPMRAELEALCPDALFLGTLSHDRVATAMASADLFFFPSTTDTLGNVVLEAQAAGLPVVVSDQGGPRQQIVVGESGLVCRAGDVEGFTRALVALLRDVPRRREMSIQARAYACRRDWPASIVPLVSAWEGAARRAAATARGPQATPRPLVLTEERPR